MRSRRSRSCSPVSTATAPCRRSAGSTRSRRSCITRGGIGCRRAARRASRKGGGHRREGTAAQDPRVGACAGSQDFRVGDCGEAWRGVSARIAWSHGLVAAGHRPGGGGARAADHLSGDLLGSEAAHGRTRADTRQPTRSSRRSLRSRGQPDGRARDRLGASASGRTGEPQAVLRVMRERKLI